MNGFLFSELFVVLFGQYRQGFKNDSIGTLRRFKSCLQSDRKFGHEALQNVISFDTLPKFEEDFVDFFQNFT